jgi:hypothetical protein
LLLNDDVTPRVEESHQSGVPWTRDKAGEVVALVVQQQARNRSTRNKNRLGDLPAK